MNEPNQNISGYDHSQVPLNKTKGSSFHDNMKQVNASQAITPNHSFFLANPKREDLLSEQVPLQTDSMAETTKRIRKDSSNSQLSNLSKVTPFIPQNETPTLDEGFKDVELLQFQNFGRIYYKYHGPKDERVHRLLEDLDQNVKPGLQIWEFLKNTNRRINYWFSEMNCCKDHTGPISFSKDTFALVVTCLAIIIYISIVYRDSSNDGNMIGLTLKYSPYMVFAFTFYGLVFLSLPSNWAYTLAFFQIMIPGLLLLADFNIYDIQYSPSPSFQTIFIRLMFIGLAVLWGLIYPCYYQLQKTVNRGTSQCYIISLYVVALLGFESLYNAQKSPDPPGSYILEHGVFVIVLAGSLASFSWLYIHYQYFQVPNPKLESFLLRTARKLLTKPNFEIETKEHLIPDTRFKRVMAIMYFVSSMVIGGVFICFEMWFASGILYSAEKGRMDGVYLFTFLIVGIPLFFFLGLPLAINTNFSPKNKMLVLPILILFPVIGCVLLANEILDSGHGTSLATYLIISPPIALFYWLFMTLIYIYHRRVFYLIAILTFIFFWIPVFILKPIQDVSIYDISSLLSGFIYFLIAIGIGLLVLFLFGELFLFVYHMIKEKLINLRNLYRLYRLQKLKIRLEQIRLKVMGSRGVLDAELNEIEQMQDADGILDMIDERSPSIKEVRSYDPSSPLSPDSSPIAVDQEVIQRRRTTFIAKSQILNPSLRLDLKKEEVKLIEEIETLSKLIIPSKKGNSRSTRAAMLENKFKLKFKELIYLNLKNFGYWINAASFIVSYTFILYVYFNLSNAATSSEKGIMGALTVIIPVIFIVLNGVIRMKSAATPPWESFNEDYDLRFVSDRRNKDPQIVKRITKVEALFLIIGAIIIPLLQIPLFFVLEDDGARQANLFTLILSILFSIIVGLILEFKKRTGPFHKFFVPIVVTICWLFFIMPYLVMFPIISAVIPGETEDYELFLKILILTSALCFMLLNTSIAIILNIILQKIEEEKLTKFVVRYLKRILKKNAVKGLDVALRKLYEQYIKQGAQIEALSNVKRIINLNERVKIPEAKRNFTYSHLLMVFEAYAKILRKNSDKNEEGNKVSCIDKMLTCCFEEDNEEEIIESQPQEPPSPITLQEPPKETHFKVDLYMPADLIQEHDYINKKSDTKQSMPTLGPYKVTEIMPSTRSAKYDLNIKDMMTKYLERIKSKELSKKDEYFQLSKEHAKMMFYDIEMLEEWYQNVFDFFSGMTKLTIIDHRSEGMLFVNFRHFLRLSTLSNIVDGNKAKSYFLSKTLSRLGDIKYLNYCDFIEILHEIALELFPGVTGQKCLKKITKKVYANVMANCQGIAKNYNENTRRYRKNLIIYPKMLQVFYGEAGYNPEATDSSKEYTPEKSKSQLTIDTRPRGSTPTNHIMVYPDTPVTLRLMNDTTPYTPDILIKNKSSDRNKKDNDDKYAKANKKKKKSCFKSCGKCLQSCLRSFFALLTKCCRGLCGGWFSRCGEWLDVKVKKLGKWLGFEVDDYDEFDDVEESKIKLEAPPWPIIVDIMIKNIPAAEKIYFEKEKNKGLRLMFNLTNIIAIIGKIMEIYGYISYAFRSEIPWFSSPEINIEVSEYMNVLNGSGISKFRTTFWMSISLVVIYTILAKFVIQSLKRGNLGEDEEGRPVKFPNPRYLVVLAVQTIGGSLFQTIIKWLLDAFVCNFDENPWVMARDETVECLSNQHFVYIIFGVLAIVIYYPLCTFMFPNFQFQNKMLDLKYHPSWMVILIQVKLVLSIIFSFFKSTQSQDSSSNVEIQLISTFVIMTILAIADIYLRPCLVKKFNIFDAGAYSLAAFINMTSLILYLTSERTGMLILLFVGSFVFILATIIVYKIFYSKIEIIKKKKKPNEEVLIYDESKRKPENKDLERMRQEIEEAKKEQAAKEALEKENERERNRDLQNIIDRERKSKTPELQEDEAVFYF